MLFARAGCTMLGYLDTLDGQAVASRDAHTGLGLLTIAGTRLHDGLSFELASDLLADADFDPLGGWLPQGRVAAGAARGLLHLVAWAGMMFAAAGVTRYSVEGHSLGAQRACLLARAENVATVTAWEPPKAADAAAWAYLAAPGAAPITQIVHGRDPFFGWPWADRDLCHAPGPVLWLREAGGFEWIDPETWPGGDPFEAADHDTDRIEAAVRALAAPP